MLRWLFVCATLCTGCAAPFGEFGLLRTEGEHVPEPQPERVASSRSPKAAEFPPKQPPAVAPPSGGAAQAKQSHSPPAESMPPQLAEFQDVLSGHGSKLSPEHQQYLREQLLAILAMPAVNQPRDGDAKVMHQDGGLRESGNSPAPPAPVLPGPEHEVPPPNIDRRPLRVTSISRTPSVTSTLTGGDHSAPHAAAVMPIVKPNSEGVALASSSTPLKSDAAIADQKSGLSSPPEPGQWRVELGRTLDLLERELEALPHSEKENATLAAYVRLLHAVANNTEGAVRAIEGMPEDEQEYWKHQVHALLLALDAQDQHASGPRAALTLRELRYAIEHLANQSTLDVRNLAFCESVESYGRFKEFHIQSFRPGAAVILYVEVDNFTVESVQGKYETELQGTYEIFDANGARVTNVKLPLNKDVCNNRRRDYFITYEIVLPQELQTGSYTLRLMLEDVKGHKSSQAKLDFKIR